MVKEKSNTTAMTPTPVTILWKGILMLPIVGVVDSKRAQDMMELMLAKILETEATIIILDISGVAAMDSAVTNHLIKVTKATRLMGADTIITGISPAIAQTLAHLGVELKDVVTRSTLKDGLKMAFDTLGLEVREIKKAIEKK